MCGVDVDFCPFIVAGGSPYTTVCITINWQALNIYGATANSLVRFSSTANAQSEGVAMKLVSIKTSDAVTVGDARQIDKINESINLVKLLPLKHTTDESL